MGQTKVGRSLQVGFVLGTFAFGFLCGSASQRRADAQLGDRGNAGRVDLTDAQIAYLADRLFVPTPTSAMEKAGESGGALGSAVQLGSAIVDMQQHVDGLQKNIDVLKKVKTSLGG